MRASGTKRTAKRTDAESDVPTASEQNASEAMRLNGQDRSGEAPKKDSKAEQMSFWDYAESLGDQWLSGDLKAYVYRVWPRIDTQQDKVYLSIVQEPPTEEFLLRSYGSGRDLVLLKRRGKLLRKHTASVHNREFPPKLDESEVIDDPANESYWRAGKKSSAAGSESGERSVKDVPADVAALLNTVVSKSGAFDPAIAAMWERTARERDALATALSERHAPPNLLDLVRGIKELLPNPAPPPPPDKSEVLELISALKGLQTAPPDPLQLMATAKDQFAPAAGPEAPRNHIAELDQILGFAQKLASLRTGNSGDRSGWDIGLDFAKELSQPLIQLITNFMSLRMQSQRGAVPFGPGAFPAAPVGAFDPYANPELLRQHARGLCCEKWIPPGSEFSKVSLNLQAAIPNSR